MISTNLSTNHDIFRHFPILNLIYHIPPNHKIIDKYSIFNVSTLFRSQYLHCSIELTAKPAILPYSGSSPSTPNCSKPLIFLHFQAFTIKSTEHDQNIRIKKAIAETMTFPVYFLLFYPLFPKTTHTVAL